MAISLAEQVQITSQAYVVDTVLLDEVQAAFLEPCQRLKAVGGLRMIQGGQEHRVELWAGRSSR